ncbi:hypothetical protein L596_018095 [Steinernema carpocapsae]|uniref:Uncharacterized protein n=1 Tax=Steinernema carpocapsae TaxID=34508 RepID=A0A4U5N3L3_STECR|nr:hypothetical protein L596_018095 [Steinernema carpocapsae]
MDGLSGGLHNLAFTGSLRGLQGFAVKPQMTKPPNIVVFTGDDKDSFERAEANILRGGAGEQIHRVPHRLDLVGGSSVVRKEHRVPLGGRRRREAGHGDVGED